MNKEPKPVDILSCGDKDITFRQIQKDFLLHVEKNYNDFDVFVGNLPVAAGKSKCATALSTWHKQNKYGTVGVVTPTIMLQNQYERDFENIPMLKGQTHYPCVTSGGNTSCAKFKKQNENKKLCTEEQIEKCTGKRQNCTYRQAVDTVVTAKTGIFNVHSLMYGLYKVGQSSKKVLIIDEGHNVVDILTELFSDTVWDIEVPFPDFDVSEKFNKSYRLKPEEVASWLKDSYRYNVIETLTVLEGTKDADKKLVEYYEEKLDKIDGLLDGLKKYPNDILILQKLGVYQNNIPDKAYSKFNKQERKYIYFKPLRVDTIGHVIWPKMVDKIIFLSATINKQDVIRLGLDKRKVSYFKGISPIDKKQRPIVFWPVADMARKHRTESTPKIVSAIQALAKKHHDTKGVVHATYEVAMQLRNIVGKNNRFLFHDKRDKMMIYNQFLTTKEPKILIASGMSEGIDLTGDLARWQAICMVTYPSLADDVNFYHSRYDRSWYMWRVIRTIEQQYGRVCRGPNDCGVTYILDRQFDRIYNQGCGMGLWDEWFTEAMVKT